MTNVLTKVKAIFNRTLNKVDHTYETYNLAMMAMAKNTSCIHCLSVNVKPNINTIKCD
jgi:hypothetical protein